MIRPQHPTDLPDPDATTRDGGTIQGPVVIPDPETMLDPERFEDLRATIGTARLCLALADLAATLRETFGEPPAVDLDRDQTFQMAHRLTGRAGLIGFTALQDACVQLQEACATQAPLREAYARAHRMSLPTQAVIASLLRRLS